MVAADRRAHRADAVEHGGDAQHRLGARARRRSAWPSSATPVARADLVKRIEPWIEASKPGAVLFHPYISEAGERGPFVNSNARASFANLNFGAPVLRSHARRHRGLESRRAGLLRGDGRKLGRSAAHRRRRPLAGAALDPRGDAERAGAHRLPRGGGRGGRGDDRERARSAHTGTWTRRSRNG